MSFFNEIIDWYIKNKRDLPWRNTTDAYPIFLSEIILQQTRVEQGLPYYYKFLEHFPDVFTLAKADEQKVLALWQGLGYYSRARNLLKAARMIVNEFGGKFPQDYSELKKLPGVGEYTAAAIASFAFKQKVPAVDGNVLRVLSRLFNDSTPIDKNKKHFFELASEVIRPFPSDVFNQAMMEFGAVICTPKPNCVQCPVISYCKAFAKNTVNSLPVKARKVKKKDRFFYYLFIRDKDKLLLEKRIEKDIWQHMYQLPLIESKYKISDFDMFTSVILEEKGIKGNIFKKTPEKKHILTHQNIYYSFLFMEKVKFLQKKDYLVVEPDKLDDYPFPNIVRHFLKEEISI
ncbi:MAG: A/G-specific adenine glycosylase [Bacteroidetes bacterium]|nr:MAG: A/G-specific adenine glycosylase [Bacteroidota bacterium]